MWGSPADAFWGKGFLGGHKQQAQTAKRPEKNSSHGQGCKLSSASETQTTELWTTKKCVQSCSDFFLAWADTNSNLSFEDSKICTLKKKKYIYIYKYDFVHQFHSAKSQVLLQLMSGTHPFKPINSTNALSGLEDPTSEMSHQCRRHHPRSSILHFRYKGFFKKNLKPAVRRSFSLILGFLVNLSFSSESAPWSKEPEHICSVTIYHCREQIHPIS